MRPPREDYVRVTFSAHGCTFEPALEFRDGDDFATLADKLEDVATDVVAFEMPRDQMAAAKRIAERIGVTWNDRAYFVEVWQEGKRGFAQVFQPYGVPRNR